MSHKDRYAIISKANHEKYKSKADFNKFVEEYDIKWDLNLHNRKCHIIKFYITLEETDLPLSIRSIIYHYAYDIKAILNFNKTYPRDHIELKETRLITIDAYGKSSCIYHTSLWDDICYTYREFSEICELIDSLDKHLLRSWSFSLVS